MANRFYVAPPNVLQALMAGQGAYESADKRAQEAELKAGLAEAGQMLQSGGDMRNVYGRLLGLGPSALPAATALSNIERARADQEWTKTYQGGMLDIARQKQNEPKIVGSAETGYFLVDRTGRPIGPNAPAGAGPVPSGGAGPQPIIPAKPKAPKEMTVTDRKAIQNAEDENAELDSTVESLQRAGEINSQTFTGAGAGVRAWLGTKLPDMAVPDVIADPKTARITEEWQKTMNPEAIQRMASTLKGATTDFELRKFVDLLADPSTTPQTRKAVIDRMLKLSERKREINQLRMDQLRGGTYYQPGGGLSARPGAPNAVPENDRPEISEAREAIARGASRDAVVKRLRERNIKFDPRDLDL